MKQYLVLLIVCFTFGSNAQQNVSVTKHVLANGLTVLLSENHDTPQIFGAVSVKAGGKNDPKDATGIAHYLEHMLFKGTDDLCTYDYPKEKVFLDRIVAYYDTLGKTTDEATRGKIQDSINAESVRAGKYAIPNEMDRMLKQIGSTGVNAFTTEDFTAYHNAFPSNQLERWLSIYSHRFENPVFRLFQSELETVYEEKNRSMDDAFDPVFELFMKNFYKNHPYGQQPILGFTEHLKNPSLSKMYEFYNTYYVANNMVLLLSGDFDSETIMPLIEKYFGSWKQGKIPTYPTYKEEPFQGEEIVHVKATPVKAGIRGYRTPKNGDPDQIKLHLANYLLSNDESSGLFDNLTNQGDLLMMGLEPEDLNDYSGTIIYYVPKILGQKFEEAEALVDEKLNKLKTGDFDESALEAAKLSMLKEFQSSLEDNEERAMIMLALFTENRTWEDYLSDYEKIKDITKADIMQVVKTYYGDNYLTLHSTTGKVTEDKLKKPGFKPVIPEGGKRSDYYQAWSKIDFTKAPSNFVDFKKAFESGEIQKNVLLQTVENPLNSIFELSITFGTGKYYDPNLTYAADYLTVVNSESKTSTQLFNDLAKWGATYYVYGGSEDKLTLTIEGFDMYFDSILVTLHNYIETLKPDTKTYQSIVDQSLGNRKISSSDNSYLLSALKDYALYKEESPMKREYNKKEFAAINGDTLVRSFLNAMNYAWDISYSGNLGFGKVKRSILNNFPPNANILDKQKDVIIEDKLPENGSVFYINDSKAVQTQFLFIKRGSLLDTSKTAVIDAFNLYFGEDMSSLVFQEIREFRSLAYSTSARYSLGKNANHRNAFWSFVGCQGDKTQEALSVMFGLIQNMPEKPDRMKSVVDALVSEANSSKPGFREVIEVVKAWEEKGYTQDPNKEKVAEYKNMKFDDIMAFYKSEIQAGNIYLIIVGNKKKFDTGILKNYGEVNTLTKKVILP